MLLLILLTTLVNNISKMGLRILHLFEPFMRYIPTIASPTRQYSVKEKTLYTALALFIYLLCCQIPLYGVLRAEGSDPFQWMRVILASNKGTLMELGLSPILSAGWILQLLIGTGIVSLDLNTKEDKYLYDGSQKLLGIILAFGEAAAYIWSGAYGNVEDIGLINSVIILMQLMASSIIVILLDELLQKYGLGSGISLFIATNMCEIIFWKSLSPITLKTEYGTEFEGALIALVHFLLTKPNKISALYQAFYRTSSPNVSNLMATIIIFFLVVYLQGFKVDLKVISKKVSGYTSSVPIKLFYTSNMSVILQSALVSNLYFFSELLHKKFSGNFFINLLGTWQETEGRSIPVGGFAYWISPPKSIADLVLQPIHSLVYILFAMITCAFFSRFWLEISKEAPRDIAKRLKEEGMTIQGYQEKSIISTLNRYIPVAAILGGMIIGLISIFADLLGAIGSGTGILLSVSILYGYYQKIVKDKKGPTGGEVL